MMPQPDAPIPCGGDADDSQTKAPRAIDDRVDQSRWLSPTRATLPPDVASVRKKEVYVDMVAREMEEIMALHAAGLLNLDDDVMEPVLEGACAGRKSVYLVAFVNAIRRGFVTPLHQLLRPRCHHRGKR